MTIALPAILDTPAAGPLRQTLRSAIRAGKPLALDGAAVEQAGLACLQMLVAAGIAAGAAGIGFAIERPSTVLTEMAELAGLGDLLTA